MTAPNGVRLQGKKQGWSHWTTPNHVLDVVIGVGPIHLDPCWNENAGVSPLVKYDGDKLGDGLKANWATTCSAGLAFVNPPYDNVKRFVAKCVEEAAEGCEIILLVAARTETKWAHSIFDTAQALCFWEGRIAFGNPPHDSLGDKPSIPSMFAYWGPSRRLFAQSFAKHGHVFLGPHVSMRPSFPVTP